MAGCIILAVSAGCEKPIATACCVYVACALVSTRNKSPYNVLYIVEKPDGERMSLTQQQEYLKTVNAGGK